MKGKRLTAGFLAAAAMTVLLTGCSGGNGGANANGGTAAAGSDGGEGTYVMKIAHEYNDSNAIGRYFKESLIPEIEEKSGGRIEVQEFPNASLGSEVDLVGMAQMGEIAMCHIGETSASLDPTMINIWCLPYLFESEEHWDKVVNGELGKKIMSLDGSGLEVVGFMENGFREITSNKPINSLADMKGLKIRTTKSEIMLSNFEHMGAAPISMGFTELFSALETGTVDAQENAYNTIASSKFYEVQKYVAVTNHVLSTQFIVVSEDWMNSLPDDLKQVVYDACEKAQQYQHDLFREQTAADRQTCLDNGMTETTPDLSEFEAAVQPVYEEFYEKYPDAKPIVEEIQALRES